MHFVGSVTCCNVVLKTDTGCLMIEQEFTGKGVRMYVTLTYLLHGAESFLRS